MTIRYRVSRSGEQVCVLAQGKVSTLDCLNLLKKVRADVNVHAASTAVIDLRNAVYTAPDKSDLLKISKALAHMKALLKNNVALVAKGDLILFAELLATQARTLSHIPMRVFADIRAAKAFCRAGQRSAGLSVRH
jgi:hypothetical protein